MTDFSLIGLRLLREIAARGSFSAAGAELGYTQSTVSRQMATLERQVGAPLFERTNRGVRPTEDGAVLLRHATAVLDRLGAAERELAERRSGRTRRLRVGAFSSAMVRLVPEAVRVLRDTAPDVRIGLGEGGSAALVHRVRAGTLDLAVISDAAPATTDLVTEKLLDDPLLLAVGREHRLATARGVAADELAGERWITGSSRPSDGLLGAWDRGDWTPLVAFTARDWNAKIGLVAAGLGVTIVPGLSANSVGERVHLVPIRDATAFRSVQLVRPAHATTTAPAHLLATILHERARR